MGWFSDDSSWDPGNWGGIGDVPIVGDAWKGIFGDPESIKQAYDKQIQASKDAQAQMQQFLMGKKGEAQAIYAPIQSMFDRTYGTQPGIDAPKTPGVPNSGRLTSMYQGTR